VELVVINAFLFDVFHDLMRFGVPVLVWDWFVAFFEKNVFVVALEFHKIPNHGPEPMPVTVCFFVLSFGFAGGFSTVAHCDVRHRKYDPYAPSGIRGHLPACVP